jgi:hypothetical protein
MRHEPGLVDRRHIDMEARHRRESSQAERSPLG